MDNCKIMQRKLKIGRYKFAVDYMYLFHHPYIKMINMSNVNVSQLSEVDSILQVF